MSFCVSGGNQEGSMSFGVVNKIKEEYAKVKKRKLSLAKDECGFNQPTGTSKMFKKEDQLISNSSKKDVSKIVNIKSTNTYVQIVADPRSLPRAPKIFQTNTHKNEESDICSCFLTDILTAKAISTDVNERFSHRFHENKKKKKLQGKKEEELMGGMEKLQNKEMKEHTELQADVSSDETGENITGKIDMYRVVERKALVFHLPHPAKFSFKGEVKITVIAGEVEVLGYTLNQNSANAYSPYLCAPLTVETKPVQENISVEEIQHKLKDYLSEEDCNIILSKLNPNDSILLIEKILSTFGIVINKYFDRPLFPKDLEDVSSETETLKSLQSIFSFHLSTKGRHIRRSPEWDKIPLGQITALCGGKGVGKSTLLKYYVNKFVSLGEKVLCLDFDPGQPEFSFPGCLSGVVVDQPLLGPNFTHVMDPVILCKYISSGLHSTMYWHTKKLNSGFRMVSFGDVDVSHNPSKYLECVKYIIENCRENEELIKMKWFINTMGFCKGLGVTLMTTILKLLKPNTVIQIRSSDYKNNYPIYLSPVTLNSKSGFRSMPLDDVNLSHDLRVISSCAEHKKKQLQGGLKQRQLRDIMAISYFSKMVSPPFYNFNAVQPFLIPFSKLYLGVDFLIDPKDILKAFNGNTVSLSHFQPDSGDILSVESEEDAYFKVVVKPAVSPSLGIGFVRGIDCQEKKFYIMTHLLVETLDNVNCLSLGRVSPPHSIFLKQDSVEGPTVYTTLGTIDIIQRVKRMYRTPGTPQNKGKISD